MRHIIPYCFEANSDNLTTVNLVLVFVVSSIRERLFMDQKWYAFLHKYLCTQLFEAIVKSTDIGIIHVFSCIYIFRAPRKLFEHVAARPNVQTSSEGPGTC